MTTQELAALEGIELRRVQSWCKRGRLHANKVPVSGTNAEVWDIHPDTWKAHRDELLSETRGRKKGSGNAQDATVVSG